MRYIALIYGNEAASARLTEAEQAAEINAYAAFDNEVGPSGCLLGGEALYPTTTATTVRVKDATILTTDGPFAETKEQLGAFYLFNCATRDDAIALAAKLPGARDGAVEVRPLMDF